MVQLSALWLPILLSAVFVFIVSSIIHMATPMHKGDARKMPNEDQVLDALRKNSVTPGEYMFPCPASMKDFKSPEMQEKFKRGPLGMLVVRQSCSMGSSLFQWFLYSIVISLFAGYIGSLAVPAGQHQYLKVFQIVGAAAVGMYAFNNVTNSIWKGMSWATTFKFIIDGVIYGCVTAGTFGWLWPKS